MSTLSDDGLVRLLVKKTAAELDHTIVLSVCVLTSSLATRTIRRWYRTVLGGDEAHSVVSFVGVSRTAAVASRVFARRRYESVASIQYLPVPQYCCHEI